MPGWAEKHDNDAAATPKGATPKQIVSAEQRKLREDAAKAAAAEVEPLAVLSQAEQENAAPNDTAVAQAHVKAGAVQTVADEDESKTWILKISEEIKARVKSVYLPPVGYMLPTHCPPPLPPSLLAHSLPSAPPSAQASATSRVIRWWCR